MKRLSVACGVTLLAALAIYSVVVAVRAVVVADAYEYDPAVFWSAIGLILGIGLGSLWLAWRLYRKHFTRTATRSA